jgi:hypothetical protein
LFDAAVDTDEVLSQIHIALVFTLAFIQAIFELHKIWQTLFMQTLLQTGFFFSFFIRSFMNALLQFMVKVIISAIPEEFSLVVVKVLYLRLEINDDIVVLIDCKQFGFELVGVRLHAALLIKLLNY